MHKRLFLSIPLTQNVHEQFAQYQRLANLPELNWTANKNLHVTLLFLGNVKTTSIPLLIETFATVVENSQPLVLPFKNITFAPHGKHPTMIWAEYSCTQAYEQLTVQTHQALHDFFAQHERYRLEPIIPHVTLARFKSLEQEFHLPQSVLPDLQVTSINLIESKLESMGAVHELFHTFTLK